MNDRITELEIRVSYLDQTVTELNDVVIAQGAALDMLRKRLETASARLDNLLGDGDAGDDRAPTG